MFIVVVVGKDRISPQDTRALEMEARAAQHRRGEWRAGEGRGARVNQSCQGRQGSWSWNKITEDLDVWKVQRKAVSMIIFCW